MEVISLKSNARKTLTKDFTLVQKLIGTLSRMSVLLNSLKIGYFYVFLLLYKILGVLLCCSLNLQWNLQNPAKDMQDRRSKYFWYPTPIYNSHAQSSNSDWKQWKKKHVIKTWFTWLVFISIFLCIFCIKFSWYIIYLQFTKIYPVSNILSWMLPSASAKISFAHSLLIFEAVFFFTMKISNSFC